MSQLPQLPFECIQCIVSKLDGDIFTLFKLLTVHSSFFRATLPVLYRDPYRALHNQVRQHALMRNRSWPAFSSSLRAKQLLYLLILSCRRADDLAPFLTPDWCDPISPLVSVRPLMAVYIDHLGDLLHDGWINTLKLLAPELDTTMELILIRQFRLLFLDHQKERVRDLSIPVTHLEPYMALVPHLKNLERIRFYEDELDGTQDQDTDWNQAQNLDPEEAHENHENNTPDANNPIPDAEAAEENPDATAEGNPDTSNPESDAEVAENNADTNNAAPNAVIEEEAPYATLQDNSDANNSVPGTETVEVHSMEIAGMNGNISADEYAEDAGAARNEPAERQPEGGVSDNGVGAEHEDAVHEGAENNESAGDNEGVQDISVITEADSGVQENIGEQGESEGNNGDNAIRESVNGNNEEQINHDVDGVQEHVVEANAAQNNNEDNTDRENINQHDGEQGNNENGDEGGGNQENNNNGDVNDNGNNNNGDNGDNGGQEDGEGDNAQQAPAEPPFDPTHRAVAFVKAHRALFNPSRIPEGSSQLKNQGSCRKQPPCGYGLLDIRPPYRWINPGSSDALTFDKRYIALLEAMKSPANIDFCNWMSFATLLESIPVDGITRLGQFWSDFSDVRWDQGKFLQRCRSLERFNSSLRGPTVFAWAVKEQKDHATYKALLQNGVACSVVSLAEGKSHGGHFGAGPDPVPLRRITLDKGNDLFVAPVLKDICLAFKNTLEYITVRLRSAEGDIPLGIVFNMPHLTTLDVCINPTALFTVGATFLKSCPSLKILRLVDSSTREPDMTGRLQDPWQLPNLQSLTLIGSICDVFNYGTFMHTPEVRTIRLEKSFSDFGVRKVNEEYQEYLSQPSWSWNWSLPNLRLMVLRGEPAHLFRPCVLLGAPKLQKLHLDLGAVPRTVSRARDFVSSQEGFCSPVRSLVLKGRWIMIETADLFCQFMEAWFKDLHYLRVNASEFSSHKAIVDGLRGMKDLRKAYFRRHPISYYTAWELGLEEVALKCSREWDFKRRLEVSMMEARERRIADREQQRKWETEELEETKSQEQEELEFMAMAFSFMEYGQEGVPAAKDRARCETTDSACAIDQEHEEAAERQRRKEEEEALEEQEWERESLKQLQRSVYMFKGKRYHSATQPRRT
ncbi:hypothetical protein BC939DRAFT_441084 [Gamsiella multidivaricata]|uniref:uncharacterized protein n=1 Tax=Gamsiella multidivaricata TaxID=101098 RepID=UPI0022206C66|nr:uncharacterized protein BC939DRAFT_441084 [Gamsiella multidivaricata]KAG0365910.1 hypothetical protein BGZ54_006062 [Gamsiella multidivaricata]KAI7829556.1 hypothetical protein BC939DRAFT_441084 [Gamsiella multidivaricata]